eukprot:m.56998 g.56998  ORF g.56998 m.56998 type:complete len:163 (-) comp7818_c0_seq1:303-791(-)
MDVNSQADGAKRKLQEETPERSQRPKLTPEALERRKAQREKQIGFGKNTPEYAKYKALLKEKKVKARIRTPDPVRNVSKRCFDGLLRKWRKELHEYDPEKSGEDAEASMFLDDASDSDLNMTTDSFDGEDHEDDLFTFQNPSKKKTSGLDDNDTNNILEGLL